MFVGTGYGGMGGWFRPQGEVTPNPNYVAPDRWAEGRDENGIVTLEAWASLFGAAGVDHFRGAPGPWETEIMLPKGGSIEILEAWYGHPSDESQRIDLTRRAQELLNPSGDGNVNPGTGLFSLLRDKFYRGDKLCLMADSELWGRDPAPWVWKKVVVRFRPLNH
eukprot:TRINITY_DN4479_c0_g1_i1.p1 TRINITY_DN4479_c0_g1~~TRINITY_DN4479_c0_g1_i1.p1  ORF type:complete len:164 (-),score=10.41 TRINITY_DN4479_c0_g1_i1:136-627(-)